MNTRHQDFIVFIGSEIVLCLQMLTLMNVISHFLRNYEVKKNTYTLVLSLSNFLFPCS